MSGSEMINGVYRGSIEEVFYLHKEGNKNDVCLCKEQTSELKRHQLRGLRFLYCQFKMKKPGVIMNDASGFGKKVQTAVFLDAIKHTLTEPAIILCNDMERDNWKYYFLHFGRDYKDFLSFDTSMPTLNKKIFIRSFDDMEAVSKKTWSIAVVDDPVSIKLFKPLKTLKAAFKVWVLNLNTFAAINDWINPKNTFSIQEFTPQNRTAGEIVEKAVLLDRYFEELVLSRGHDDKEEKKRQPSIKSLTKKSQNPSGGKTNQNKTITNKPSTSGSNLTNTNVNRKGKNVNRTWRKVCYSSDDSWEEPSIAKRKKANKTNSQDNSVSEEFCFLNENDKINISVDVRESTKSNILSKAYTSTLDVSKKANVNTSLNTTENYAVDKDVDLLKDLRNMSKDTSKENENRSMSSSSYSNDSIDFDLNTIPIDTEGNVADKSDEIIALNDNNLDKNEISKNYSAKKSSLSASKDANKEFIIENNNKTEHSKLNRTQDKNTTSKPNIPQAETSNSKMDESILDTKIRDLEEKTSAKYKGSLLDQLLGSNKTSPKSIRPSDNNKIINKSNEEGKATDDILKSQKANTSKVTEKVHTSPVIIAKPSPTKSSPQKIDDQIKDLEQKTYNKFKGSLLDKLF